MKNTPLVLLFLSVFVLGMTSAKACDEPAKPKAKTSLKPATKAKSSSITKSKALPAKTLVVAKTKLPKRLPAQTGASKKKTKPGQVVKPLPPKVTKGFHFVPLPPKKNVAGTGFQKNQKRQVRSTSSVNRVAAYFKKDRVAIAPEGYGDGGSVSARLVPTPNRTKVGIKHSVRTEEE